MVDTVTSHQGAKKKLFHLVGALMLSIFICSQRSVDEPVERIVGEIKSETQSGADRERIREVQFKISFICRKKVMFVLIAYELRLVRHHCKLNQ